MSVQVEFTTISINHFGSVPQNIITLKSVTAKQGSTHCGGVSPSRLFEAFGNWKI
jgi:hypothetical protein